MTLNIEGTGYEVKYKLVYGGLVSGAVMAVVNKATSKIEQARGLEKLLDLIAPYTQLHGDETTIKQATDEAVKQGAIPLSQALRFAKSEIELEQYDGEYFAVKLKAYCDILESCLDFEAMELQPITSKQFSEQFPKEQIWSIAEDFLLIAKPKPKPLDSLEDSGVSQVVKSPAIPKKPSSRIIKQSVS